MGKLRQRYNAKGRNLLPSQQINKSSSKETLDTNQDILDPSLKIVKPKHVEQVPEMSSKKRKRMEKYIERKLQKEESVKLMQKLAKSSYLSELMQSSKHIGVGKKTQRQKLRQAFLEERAGLPSSDPSVRLYQCTQESSDSDNEIGQSSLPQFATAAPLKGGVGMSPLVLQDNKQSLDLGKEDDITMTPKKKLKKNSRRKNIKTQVVAVGESSSDDDMEVEHSKEEQNEELTSKDPPVHPHQPIKTEITIASPENSSATFKPSFYVLVNRTKEVQDIRMKLPVCAEEQEIMETIRKNNVVVISGETGSGKTTQVPQFLYEAGYGHPDSDNPGMIGITEPRRVAAMSMSQRVAYELNVGGDEVSYQIRYDTNVSASTRIKFMTDGVLLKEVSQDLTLSRYSAIILDEAHERSINTDVLIGVLSRVVKLRETMAKNKEMITAKRYTKGIDGSWISVERTEVCKPLKLIVMSATLRVQDFTENRHLFKTPPPVIHINARQFEVKPHFSRWTKNDYLTEAYKKVCKIHTRLPDGGILIFVTGQNEVMTLCKRLSRKFPKKIVGDQKNASHEEVEKILTPDSTEDDMEAPDVDYDLLSDSDDIEHDENNNTAEEEEEAEEEEDVPDFSARPLHVLPLYSLLPAHQQLQVFQKPPNGARLCVIGTNVAETSLTIPGIKYVVDTGKVKERQYDEVTGIQAFEVGWISKASAEQRSGRAGRTGPGHCYKLYSSAVLEHQFEAFAKPEILRMPIEGVILQLKNMNMKNVLNFPFPTPPDRPRLVSAEKLLIHLGALNSSSSAITEVGSLMSQFPIHPRFAKMLMVAKELNVLEFAIVMVAALSVPDPFIREMALEESIEDKDEDPESKPEQNNCTQPLSKENEEKLNRKTKKNQYQQIHEKFKNGVSDILKLLVVVCASEFEDVDTFCQNNMIRKKAIEEIRKLRLQLTNITMETFPGIALAHQPKMKPPTQKQFQALRQVIAAGFIDQIAVRKDLVDSTLNSKSLHHCRKGRLISYITLYSQEEVFIHPTSVLVDAKGPGIIAYHELVRTGKLYIKGNTIIEPSWLGCFGENLCYMGKPLENPSPRYDPVKDKVICYAAPTFGPHNWQLPAMEIQHPETPEKYKHFLKLILEGEVLEWFRKYTDSLTSKPSLTLKWTQQKVMAMLNPLLKNKISTKQGLLRAWHQDPKFLLQGFQGWLPVSLHNEIAHSWPPTQEK